MDIAGTEAALLTARTRRRTLPLSVWERRGDPSLATLPGGIRLAVFTSPFIVRWAAWLVALLIVLVAGIPDTNLRFEPYLLIGTFVQTVLVTFYVPVIRLVVAPAGRRSFLRFEDYGDVLVLGLLDVALSMVAVYLSGGWGSPYFHFALTSLLIPAFFLSFRGVAVLAIAYTAAYVAALATVGDGVHGSWKDNNLSGFIGAVVTPLLVALVPNYLGSVLRDLDAARRDAVDALGETELLYGVARTFLETGNDGDEVLLRVADIARQGSPFAALVLLVSDGSGPLGETHAYGAPVGPPLDTGTLTDAFGKTTRSSAPASLPPPFENALGAYSWTASAPLQSSQAIEGWLVVASPEAPGWPAQKLRLLDALAGQIALGVRNMRLAERIAELAAEGERTRIAREIHDGIAQMIYMLSLSLETAVDRVGSDGAEQRQRLRDLTALAKNALWEVRQYIFDLRPLLSGDEGLVRAVQGQVKEFQAVSELPVELTVNGELAALSMATSAALYRIVQEGLGNIFRHARESQVHITLGFVDGCLSLSIADDGVGIGDGRHDSPGYGLDNLKQRVEELGGTLAVSSSPKAGTRIDVRVPIGGDQ